MDGRCFMLIRQLLMYHDPELAAWLQNEGVVPNMFAVPWLLTMFMQGVMTM